MKISKRATTLWNKAAISYNNYQRYIENKTNKFELTLIDLLYVSNFKGGNATIHEQESELKDKLELYSKALGETEAQFGSKRLIDLNDEELKCLVDRIDSLCSLTKKNSASKIDGFSTSYLSALLHFYFPNLLPILDRRILINIGIVTRSDINKEGQIINIERFYHKLIFEVRNKSMLESKSLRQIDEELFAIEIPK